eukprot:scaffold29016_cov228-Skeletonema_menzelii.AAC.1
MEDTRAIGRKRIAAVSKEEEDGSSGAIFQSMNAVITMLLRYQLQTNNASKRNPVVCCTIAMALKVYLGTIRPLLANVQVIHYYPGSKYITFT